MKEGQGVSQPLALLYFYGISWRQLEAYQIPSRSGMHCASRNEQISSDLYPFSIDKESVSSFSDKCGANFYQPQSDGRICRCWAGLEPNTSMQSAGDSRTHLWLRYQQPIGDNTAYIDSNLIQILRESTMDPFHIWQFYFTLAQSGGDALLRVHSTFFCA